MPFKLLLLLFTVVMAVSEAPPRDLTWTTIQEATRALHQDLLGARLALESARLEERSATGALWPQLSASASWSNALNSSPSSYTYGLGGKLPLFEGFKQYADIEQARAGVDSAASAAAKISADVRLAVRTAFLEISYVQALQPLTQRISDRRRQTANLVRLQYEGGKEEKGAWLRADVLALQAAYDVESAQRSRETARWALGRDMGRPLAAEESIQGTLAIEPPPPAALQNPLIMHTLVSRLPGYLEAVANIRAAEASQRAANAVWYPSVSLNGGLTQQGNEPLNTTGRWSVGMSMDFPFFNGGRNAAQAEQAGLRLQIARAQLAYFESASRAALSEAYAQYLDAAADVEVRRKTLEAAETRAEIAKAKYGNGLIQFQEMDLIENDAIQAQKNLLSAQRSASLGRAKWDHALGKGLED